MRLFGSRKRFLLSIKSLLLLIGTLTAVGFTLLTLRLVDPSTPEGVFTLESQKFPDEDLISISLDYPDSNSTFLAQNSNGFGRMTSIGRRTASCATVEEMGEGFGVEGDSTAWKESLRVRKLIQNHFDNNGAARVRQLPPDKFCRHGFVIAKASEAGFGNEMYKILSGAALSIMLNRSFIIGQTRHIGENILLGTTSLTQMFHLR